MCGIFGRVAVGQTPRAVVDCALASLAHRGPDSSGWVSIAGQRRTCTLVHTRLAIIDLSPGGAQPMRTSDGRLSLVFNGELFNYRELRRDLEATGVQFRSDSDTEVLLQAFVRWGPECVRRLRGFFAFAVFDRAVDALFLARDRLGIKPLYVAVRGQEIMFSSEVRTLLGAGVEPRLDAGAVAGYLATGSFAEPETAVSGIRLMPAGTTLTYTPDRVTSERYWEVPFKQTPCFANAGDAAEALRTELKESVRLRLVSDVPLAIFLSGGMDSAALVALASQVSSQPVRTFTVGFSESEFDESSEAQAVADRYGCRHTLVHLSDIRAASEIDNAVRSLDQPSADGINTYFVAQATKTAGISVALSGLGGDELFAGYHYFQQFARLMALRPALRLLDWLPGKDLVAASDLALARSRLQKGISLAGTRGHPDQVYATLRSMFLPAQVRALLASPSRILPSPVYVPWGVGDGGSRTDPVNAFSALDLSNYMRNTLLRDTDVMSMAHALEVRVPMLDHRVVELAMAIPGWQKASGGGRKPILALAMGTLPPASKGMEKKGFTLPFDDWFRGSLRSWMEERLLGEPMRHLALVDSKVASRMWTGYLRGEGRGSHSRVWSIAVLADWCWRHRVGS